MELYVNVFVDLFEIKDRQRSLCNKIGSVRHPPTLQT